MSGSGVPACDADCMLMPTEHREAKPVVLASNRGRHSPNLIKLVEWWALQDSNLRPSPCKGAALPLRQAPDPVAKRVLTMEQNGFRASPKHRQKRRLTGKTGTAPAPGGVHSCAHLLRQTTGAGAIRSGDFVVQFSQIELQKSLGRLGFLSITLWPQSIL